MEFRKSKTEDIPGIMRIIRQAQEYMKKQGIDQWQNGYPNEAVFQEDILKGYGYVMEEEGGIIGTIAVLFDGEPTYDRIYEGAWITQGIPYAAIHRVAVDAQLKGRGIAGRMIKEVEKMCLEQGVYGIKNDTHRENLSMRKMQKKNGFEYCGIIYLEDGAERIACEKKLQ